MTNQHPVKSKSCAVFLCCVVLLLTGCQSDLAFNQYQFLGSHNSYKKPIDDSLLQLLAAKDKAMAESLDYSHPSLAAQFDLGIRKIELDVYYDPDGGRYSEPSGLKMTPEPSAFDPNSLLSKPGFKVLHVQDIDFRSHCLSFSQCLTDIRDWSDRHQNHFPIVVLINAKTDEIPLPQFTVPLEFDQQAWRQLDTEIRSILSDRLFTPDDFRGTEENLQTAVSRGWPKLNHLRGKVLFVLDDSPDKVQAYVEKHPMLAGLAMFADLHESSGDAVIRIVNEPVKQEAYIRDLVKRGYLVRTRADADTIEARSNDKKRLAAAIRSGAQIISTDYYVQDEKYGLGYKASLSESSQSLVAICNRQLTSLPCEIVE